MVDIEDSFKSLSIRQNAFNLSPSKYGMYVSLDCQLYIRKASGPSVQSNEMSKRLQLRGSNWESRICELLSSQREESVVYEDCTDVNFEVHLRNILKKRSDKLIYYLYQPSMAIKKEMNPQSLRNAGGQVSKIIPDFLKLHRISTTDPWTLTVIDAKSSLTLKQSHQAQVAFYSYFIERIFSREIDAGKLKMSVYGVIWLQPSTSDADIINTQQQFQLRPWLELLDTHLEGDLPTAFNSALEDVPWHLNMKCASCPYINDCKTPKSYGMDIRALPNISRADSEYLQDVSRRYAQTLPQRRGTAVPIANAVQTLVEALRREKHERAERILGMTRSDGLLASVLEQRVVVRGHLYGGLPRSISQGASVYLSLHCDPATDLPFAFGILAYRGEGQVVIEVVEHAQWTDNVAVLQTREEALLLSFLSSLRALLCGGALPPSSPVMVYVWDSLDHFCLNQLVIKALSGQFSAVLDSHADLCAALYYIALVLLNFPEQWHLPAPPTNISHTTQFASTPRVCDVSQAYRALVHLPVPGFYSPSAIHSLVARQSATDISAASIERTWQAAEGVKLVAVLRTRLAGLRSAVTYLHDQVTVHNPTLLFNSAPALLDTAAVATPAGDPLAERLLFMKQVDCLVRCDTARLRRIAAVNGSVSQLMRLRCLQQQGKMWYFIQESGELVTPSASSAEFVKKFCLVRDDEALVTQYCDYQNLSESSSCSNWSYRFVNIKETGRSGTQWRVGIEMKSETFLTPNAVYILFEREVDLVVQKCEDSLRQASAHLVPGTFADVVRNPNSWGKLSTLAGVSCARLDSARIAVDNVYSSYCRLHTNCPQAAVGPLTRVQAAAFQKVLTERLTILWGPPGTGKTHFAAKCMLNLFEMTARCGSTGLRVLVTATTHTAIDEILHKFLTLRDLALSIPHRGDVAAWAGDKLKVFKLTAKPSSAADQIAGVHYTVSANVVKKPRFAVLGATVWALYKDGKYRDTAAFREQFDVVVMDEASQMQVADALMPLCCLRGDDQGRLLVVGDTLQLPPIFAYKFGPPPAGVPAVQSSILECLLRSDDNRTVDLTAVVEGRAAHPLRMIKLSENYRMNSVLSRFTSRLYGQDYEPSGTSRNSTGRWTVAREAGRRLDTAALHSALPAAVLDSEGRLPEILAVRLVPHGPGSLRGHTQLLSAAELALTTSLQHTHAEAAFVAQLVDGLASSHASLDADSAAQRIFVCTPHNAQKSAVKAALASLQRAHWGEVADTVERMQGQERDVVVICLGVLSKEVLDKEVDFLFSKPRLNVAISRAKQTCILLYTDVLTALNPTVIGNPDAYLAYEHLQAFISAAEQFGKLIDVPVLL